MSSYNEQMQKLAREYKRANGVNLIDLDKVCDWALINKKWEPDPVRVRRVFKELLSAALREEFETDPQGRRVRVNHRIVAEDSKGRQGSIWGDIKTATRDFLHKGFQLRRKQSFSDLRQLKFDVDSVNENRFQGEPIPMQYDFSKELIESDLVRTRTMAHTKPSKRPFGHSHSVELKSTPANVATLP